MKTARNWFIEMWNEIDDFADRPSMETMISRIQQDAIKSCASKSNLNGMDKKVKKLVGKDVYINWKDSSKWHTFNVISIDCPHVELKAIESLDGNKNITGLPFHVHCGDIESIREIGPK